MALQILIALLLIAITINESFAESKDKTSFEEEAYGVKFANECEGADYE